MDAGKVRESGDSGSRSRGELFQLSSSRSLHRVQVFYSITEIYPASPAISLAHLTSAQLDAVRQVAQREKVPPFRMTHKNTKMEGAFFQISFQYSGGPMTCWVLGSLISTLAQTHLHILALYITR